MVGAVVAGASLIYQFYNYGITGAWGKDVGWPATTPARSEEVRDGDDTD